MSAEWANFILQAVIFIVGGCLGAWKLTEKMKKEFSDKFDHAQKNQSAAFAMQAEIQKKSIDRVYERMDERNEEIQKTFVRLDVHNITLQNLEEKTSEKFKTTIEKFELTIQNLTKVVMDLVEQNRRK